MAKADGMLQRLKDHPFFRDLDDKSLGQLAKCADERHYEAGTYIAREGDPADRFFVLRHGTVAVELTAPGRGRLTLQTLGEGDILGWSWLVPPHRWAFSARAVTLTRTLSLDAEKLRNKMEENHELGYRLLQRFLPVMAARVHASRLQMLDLYAPPGREGL
mgnify:CR=1 FL=1